MYEDGLGIFSLGKKLESFFLYNNQFVSLLNGNSIFIEQEFGRLADEEFNFTFSKSSYSESALKFDLDYHQNSFVRNFKCNPFIFEHLDEYQNSFYSKYSFRDFYSAEKINNNYEFIVNFIIWTFVDPVKIDTLLKIYPAKKTTWVKPGFQKIIQHLNVLHAGIGLRNGKHVYKIYLDGKMNDLSMIFHAIKNLKIKHFEKKIDELKDKFPNLCTTIALDFIDDEVSRVGVEFNFLSKGKNTDLINDLNLRTITFLDLNENIFFERKLIDIFESKCFYKKNDELTFGLNHLKWSFDRSGNDAWKKYYLLRNM